MYLSGVFLHRELCRFTVLLSFSSYLLLCFVFACDKITIILSDADAKGDDLWKRQQ